MTRWLPIAHRARYTARWQSGWTFTFEWLGCLVELRLIRRLR